MTRLFLSVAETAETLGVSDDLVYELIARGDLPAAELGRRKVVPTRAIELVEERALAGFDPDRILTALAGAAGPSSTALASPGARDEDGPTGAAEPSPPSSAVAHGSVTPLRR